MHEVVERFAELFAGETMAYGADHGECVKKPVTFTTFQAHLLGMEPIGIYPVYDGHLTRWGCIDIDEDDYNLACNLDTCLGAMRIRAWIEVSKSKGYHVWIFCEPTEAAHVRRTLLVACEAIGYKPKEVNPKREIVAEGQYTNYVRLPYPGELSRDEHDPWPIGSKPRQVMIEDAEGLKIQGKLAQRIIPFREFLFKAPIARAKPDLLERWARHYTPPQTARMDSTLVPDGNAADIMRNVSGDAWKAWYYGPKDGYDRSSSMMRLAHLLREEGLRPLQAMAVLIDADARWGKHFMERPDGQKYIDDMIRKAWA